MGSFSYLFRLGIRVDTMHWRNIRRSRQIVNNRIQKRLYAFVLESRATKHWCALVQYGGTPQGRANVIVADWFFRDIFVQQFIVQFGNFFNHVRAQFLSLFAIIPWNFLYLVVGAESLIQIDIGLLLNQIDYALELIFESQWNLKRNRYRTQSLPHGRECTLKIGSLPIEFVDKRKAGNLVFVRLTP